MAGPMSKTWEELDHDPVSGRRIFSRDVPTHQGGYYGTYSFKVEKDFQVRSADGTVLRQLSGTARGEYWCGVFLFFVHGADGKQVRLDESDRDEDEIYDVPDTPLPEDKIMK